jgi:hypothetical protein
MNILGHLTVLPQLPEALERLDELAHNLYWSWQSDARALFRRIDRPLWEKARHNPVALLRDVDQARLGARADEHGFHLRDVGIAQAEVGGEGHDRPVARVGEGRRGGGGAAARASATHHDSMKIIGGRRGGL